MELILSAITFTVAGISGYILGRNKDSGQSLPSPIEQMEVESKRIKNEIDKQFSDLNTEDTVKSSRVVANCFICHGSGVAFTYDAYGGGAVPCRCDAGSRIISRLPQELSDLALYSQLQKLSLQKASVKLDRALKSLNKTSKGENV